MNVEINSRDFTSVDNPVVNSNNDDDVSIKRHGNKKYQQVPPTQNSNRVENETGTSLSGPDLNESSKVTIGPTKEEEEYFRNCGFLFGFVIKIVQMLVTLVLLVVGVVWEPLHEFLQNHKMTLFVSLMILGMFIYAFEKSDETGSKDSKWITFCFAFLIYNLFLVNVFWFLVAATYDDSVFSPYWIILAAIIVTVDYTFLSVLIYFQKTFYNDWAIHIFAAFIPLLVLIFSQVYYFGWHVKLPVHSIVPYSTYMLNVGTATGYAIISVFDVVRHLQKIARECEITQRTTSADGGQDIESQPVHL